jgi:replication factor A1
MEVKDIHANAVIDILDAEIVEIGDSRQFSKFGKAGRVSTAKIKDKTGEVKLSLWNEQIDQVKVGSKIRILNGWATEWKGEIQVSTGNRGTMTIV